MPGKPLAEDMDTQLYPVKIGADLSAIAEFSGAAAHILNCRLIKIVQADVLIFRGDDTGDIVGSCLMERFAPLAAVFLIMFPEPAGGQRLPVFQIKLRVGDCLREHRLIEICFSCGFQFKDMCLSIVLI